jgi:transcriptional regulator with XRE-family HTH domain
MARIDVGGIGGFIREQRDQAQMSLRQLAKAADVSNPYLSQVERGLRKPSAEILNRIASGLRISAETLYVQAGILDQRDGDESVTTAIASDLTLSERQRTTLLQIYAAFQSENRAQAERAHERHDTDETTGPPTTGDQSTEHDHEPEADQPEADRKEQR